jgi:hypothetical protein
VTVEFPEESENLGFTVTWASILLYFLSNVPFLVLHMFSLPALFVFYWVNGWHDGNTVEPRIRYHLLLSINSGYRMFQDPFCIL